MRKPPSHPGHAGVLAAGTVLLWLGQANAQPVQVTERAPERFQIGVGGLFGVPFGVLHDVVGLSGGVGFEYLHRLPFAPVLLFGFNGELWQHSSDPNALNSDLAGHLIVRFQRPAGSLRPYADFIIGLDYIAAHVKDVESAVLETRALGLGVGGGLTRLLSEAHPVSIDVRARFRYASPADILSAGLVRPNVRTTMLTLYVGFSVGL